MNVGVRPTVLAGEEAGSKLDKARELKVPVDYVRYRGATGDKGRILRQQEFLKNLTRSFANPLFLFKFPNLIAVTMENVHTNLSFWDMVALALSARRVRHRDVNFFILPGKPSGAVECLGFVAAAIPHCLEVLQGVPISC